MTRPIALVSAVAAAALCANADDPPKPEQEKPGLIKPDRPRAKVGLDTEIERGTATDRITIFVYNEGDESFEFENGAAGGPGSLDDRAGGALGTAPTVLPIVTFTAAEGDRATLGPRSVTLRPPAFGGLTRRSMRPHVVTVPPHGRIAYASFLVPQEYTRGTFGGAQLDLPPTPKRGDQPGRPARELFGFTLTEVKGEGKP